MSVYLIKLVKPLVVSAFVGLVAVHFVTPLNAATIAVGALWALSMFWL